MKYLYSRRDKSDQLIRPQRREWGIDLDHKKRVRYTGGSHSNLPIAEFVEYIDVPDAVVMEQQVGIKEYQQLMFFPSVPNHYMAGWNFDNDLPSSAPLRSDKVTVLALTLFSGHTRTMLLCTPEFKEIMLDLSSPLEFWEQVQAYQRGEKVLPYTPLPIVQLADCRFTNLG